MPIIIDPRTGLPVPSRTDKAPRIKRQGRVPGPGDVAQIDAQVLRDPGVHATPADFGAGIAKAVEQFGAAASRVASDFAEMRREAEDDTAATAGLADARVRFTKVAQSMETQATTTEGLTGNLGKALSGETDAILRDLRQVRGLRPSERGEAAIRHRLGLLASRMVARGAMSEHRIRLAKLGHHVDFSVADAAMAAFGAPADVFAIIAETEANLARFKNKLPPDILAAKVTAAREMIAGNAVAGLIEQGDVATARTLLEAAGTGEDVSLSPEQAGRLRKAVDRVEDQARRARRPAAEAEIEDHLASIQATGAGMGGIAERARAALDGKAFKAFERDEKDAHAFHETMEFLKFVRPEVIERELESRRPKRGARNFTEKQRRFQALERGAKQMLNVRARDGAAFVMEIGDVRAAFERAGDDGPSLRRALKFRMAIQSEIGIPEDRVRLLTRPEAGALASEVQSAAVEDRAAKVAGLQDLYGPLFGRAMKELTQAGLDPRLRALAGARDNPALARTIAKALEPGGAGPEKALDPAGSQEVRGRIRDLTADARPDAEGETADAIDAIVSAAEALGVEYLRQTGRVEESAARAAAFANGAIEDARLAAADGGAVDAGDGGEKRSGGDEPEPRAGLDDDTPEDGTPRGSGPDADVVPSARKLGTDGLNGVQKRRIADAKAEFDKLAGLQPGSPEFQRARERLSRLQQRLTKTERLELVRQVVGDIPLRGLGGRGTDRLLADGQPNRPTGELRRPSFRSEFVENTLLGQLTLKPLGDTIAGLRGMAGLDPVNPFSGRILSKKEVQETNVLTLVGAGIAGAGRLATLARNIPAPRTLGNVKARQWYLQQLDALPDALDGSRPLDVQAKLAHRLRNEARHASREAMKDQKMTKTLSPNRTFEEMIQRARNKGFEGDGIWKYIIDRASESNPVVDMAMGLKRRK